MHCVLQSNIFIAVIGENRIVRLIWAHIARITAAQRYDWLRTHSRRLNLGASEQLRPIAAGHLFA